MTADQFKRVWRSAPMNFADLVISIWYLCYWFIELLVNVKNSLIYANDPIKFPFQFFINKFLIEFSKLKHMDGLKRINCKYRMCFEMCMNLVKICSADV